MAQFDPTNFNRFVLETEDDSGSPYNEELAQQSRQNFVGLLLLLLDTGDSGTATSDPPNDTTGWIYCVGCAFDVDEHNGRTVLITSGSAKGLFYTIDDTTATALRCNGDNLYAAGFRSGDTFKILYDLKTNFDGHDHDGVNSKLAAGVGVGSIIPSQLKSTCHAGGSGTRSYGNCISIALSDYSFFPNVYSQVPMDFSGYSSWSNDCVGRFRICNNYFEEFSPNRNYQYRYRYLHASGPTYMQVIRDRKTGLVQHVFFAEDPPPDGQKGIVLTDREGKEIDMEPHEEIVVTDFDREIIDDIVDAAGSEEKLYHEILNEDFTFDEEKKIFVKNNLATV